MKAFENMNVYYGDIHTHCGISYGHGTLDEALRNARQQLDFCSVTGHAHWPDMPQETPATKPILDYHRTGFERLKQFWPGTLERVRTESRDGEFVVFPGFEIHSLASGDRTIVYKDPAGEILYVRDMSELHRVLKELNGRGSAVMSFPHHIGYLKGARGIDWTSLDPATEPVVEVVSMHGASESSETPRPFLRSMGPSDWESTVQYGLEQGHIFGFTGNTDHHSACPGSYGHGRTAVWAGRLTREAIWGAYQDRRVYALTGDRMTVEFSVNDAPMGSVIRNTGRRRIDFSVAAGGALDYVDIIRNNKLLKRYSGEDEKAASDDGKAIHTKIFLEVGWGDKRHEMKWDIDFGVSDGAIVAVEPRFRGQDVVSPRDKTDGSSDCCPSAWARLDGRHVHFSTTTRGNPTATTTATQGLCLEVRVPAGACIEATINDRRERIPVERLLAGAYARPMGGISSPFYRFNRAPHYREWNWRTVIDDTFDRPGFYYLRIRQKNDQWAWVTPVFVR